VNKKVIGLNAMPERALTADPAFEYRQIATHYYANPMLERTSLALDLA
jgi:hypothetical protein